MLSRYTTYKNIGNGIWNRAAVPDNDQVVSADNCGSFFSGAGDNGLIKRSLIVGNSLNYNMNGVTRPNVWGADQPVALASYHSSFDLRDNFILNFPAVANEPSGAFNLSDYYLIPVDKGLIRNVNNTLVNSHPGVRTMPSEPHFAFGALWDPHDYWGGTTAQDNYYVFNTPFFTHGQTPSIVAPSPAVSGGVLVTGPFYGVANFVINKANSPYYPLMHLDVNRKDTNMNNVGNWTITQGPDQGLLSNMRHFATHPTGIYDLNFPTVSNVNDLTFEISNMLTTNDYQVVGVEYSGNYLISGLFSTIQYNNQEFGGSIPMPTVSNDETHIYQAVSSLAAVRAAPTGEVYWQDIINNKVWFKIRGGLNTGDPNIPITDDYNLYKRFGMRMFGVAAPLSIEANTFDLDAKNLVLYPNPSSSEISIKWTNFNNLNDDILIANSIGQIIYKKQSQQLSGENMVQIDINNWSNGIYFVKVGKETVKLIKSSN